MIKAPIRIVSTLLQIIVLLIAIIGYQSEASKKMTSNQTTKKKHILFIGASQTSHILHMQGLAEEMAHREYKVTFAALESDPNKVSKPVLFENLNPKLVIKHCTTDIKKSRNSENISRFYLQRARGYLKNRSISDAISDLNKSYELGYPVAAFALATLFYLGDDVTQDFELAKKLYFESYNNGVIWAAKGLYFLYSNPNYIKNDKKLANMWKNLFIVQLNNNPSFSFD